MAELNTFVAGTGISAPKLNENFETLKNLSNENESRISTLADTALLKDGSNITQDLVNKVNTKNVTIIENSGEISLEDNSENILTLIGDGVIKLPTFATDDNLSHTISLIVMGSEYTLDINTATGGKHLINDLGVNPENPYSVLFIYNKIDRSWYYSLAQ